MGKLITVGVLGLFALIFTLGGITTVDAGQVGVVKHFGELSGELYPGLHWLNPISNSVYKIPVQTRIVQPDEESSSKDLQVVRTRVTLAYHVDPGFATFILATLNDDAETRIINPAIIEAVKSTTAQYDAAELITQRPKVRDGIEDAVKARIAPYHLVAEQVAITNFSFSDDYNHAIEAKVTAQQQAEKALNDLARIKTEAQQKVAAAQGEADALRVQKEQITPELLQLRTIEMLNNKWNGQMPQVILGGEKGSPLLNIGGLNTR